VADQAAVVVVVLQVQLRVQAHQVKVIQAEMVLRRQTFQLVVVVVELVPLVLLDLWVMAVMVVHLLFQEVLLLMPAAEVAVDLLLELELEEQVAVVLEVLVTLEQQELQTLEVVVAVDLKYHLDL
jgi:hypothetical protein